MADMPGFYSRKALGIPEILDMILKRFNIKWKGKEILKTCSQVARLWRDTSQPYFFSDVVVKTTLQDQHCQEFDIFLDFLEKSTRVRSYIRTVHLRGVSLRKKKVPTQKVYLSTIRSIIQLLPRLDEVRISGVCLLQDNGYVRESSAVLHRSISLLLLKEISVPTFSYGFAECMEVIRLFTSIQSLVVFDLPIGADGLTSRKRKLVGAELPVQVSRLSVQSYHYYGRQVQYPELMGSLLQTICFPSLRSLDLGDLSKEGIRSQQLVLQEAKQHGRRVYVALSDIEYSGKQICKAARAQPSKAWSLLEISRFVGSGRRDKLPIVLRMEKATEDEEYLELSA